MPMKYPEAPPTTMLVVEDTGIAWGMGCLGGGVYAGVKGFRNSPRGSKLAGAWMSAKIRGPVFGGNFAVWGGLFTVSDQMLGKLRGAKDGYNSILAGAMTGGALAARAGFQQMYRNAAIGGVLLGLIECFTIMMGAGIGDDPNVDKAVSLGFGESPVSWAGMKSYWRLPERSSVPKEGPGFFRRFRAQWDGLFGPWATQWPAEPIPGYFAGKFEKRWALLESHYGNKKIRTPLQKRAHKEDLAVARLRDELWRMRQEGPRSRKRGDPQAGFVVSPPDVAAARL